MTAFTIPILIEEYFNNYRCAPCLLFVGKREYVEVANLDFGMELVPVLSERHLAVGDFAVCSDRIASVYAGIDSLRRIKIYFPDGIISNSGKTPLLSVPIYITEEEGRCIFARTVS